MGFGSGLNALLACEYAEAQKIKLNYISLEKFPVTALVLLADQNSQLYKQIIECEWNTEILITKNFNLKKIKTDILTFNFETVLPIDVVFYDAFSPDKQPELWTAELFTYLFSAMQPGGILATYSSKGMVKEALRTAGFVVKRLPGPHGKRHILNAFKK